LADVTDDIGSGLAIGAGPPPIGSPASSPSPSPDGWFDGAALSDVGTERDHNEDHCGVQLDGRSGGIVVVADGISGFAAGEEASHQAVEVTLRSFAELGPGVPPGKRIVRAVQQANIEIYDRALVVPELRGMATTLTALALSKEEAFAAHVGDTRVYLVRSGAITQLTKDHTVVAERVRLGLLSEERARNHPERSTVTRSVGRELIVAVDRITTRIWRGDVLIVCSDGLYNVLEPDEMRELVASGPAAAVCRGLIDAANQRGTIDNLTAAVVRVGPPAPVQPEPEPAGVGARLKRLLGWRTP
jgi:serine/threonine protein phosphatase PrpC